MDELKRSAVNVDNMQQKKIIQPNFMLQKDDTSSMAKSSPPTGAPKAAATPAAAPAVVKFRLVNKESIAFIFGWWNITLICFVYGMLENHWKKNKTAILVQTCLQSSWIC